MALSLSARLVTTTSRALASPSRARAFHAKATARGSFALPASMRMAGMSDLSPIWPRTQAAVRRERVSPLTRMVRRAARCSRSPARTSAAAAMMAKMGSSPATAWREHLPVAHLIHLEQTLCRVDSPLARGIDQNGVEHGGCGGIAAAHGFAGQAAAALVVLLCVESRTDIMGDRRAESRSSQAFGRMHARPELLARESLAQLADRTYCAGRRGKRGVLGRKAAGGQQERDEGRADHGDVTFPWGAFAGAHGTYRGGMPRRKAQ